MGYPEHEMTYQKMMRLAEGDEIIRVQFRIRMRVKRLEPDRRCLSS